MAAKTSRQLVIDTSVVRAAGGEEAVHPTSKNCRDFLIAVLNICHRVVLTDDIKAEWKSHLSDFSYTWLTEMVGRRKVVRPHNVRNDELRQDIRENAKNGRECEEMMKDTHLIEAALVTNKTVASLDETVRGLFHRISTEVPELKPIVWVNPDRVKEERPIKWLKEGAKAEKKRTLGFRSEQSKG